MIRALSSMSSSPSSSPSPSSSEDDDDGNDTYVVSPVDKGLVEDEWEIRFDQLKLEKVIGEGSFGIGLFTIIARMNPLLPSPHSSACSSSHLFSWCSLSRHLSWNSGCHQEIAERTRQVHSEICRARVDHAEVGILVVQGEWIPSL